MKLEFEGYVHRGTKLEKIVRWDDYQMLSSGVRLFFPNYVYKDDMDSNCEKKISIVIEVKEINYERRT